MKDKVIKFIPYGRQDVTEEDIAKVIEVLKSEFLTQGPVVENFEGKITEKTGSKYSLVVNSATSALHLACLSLGLSVGDWLWTSPITFVASANCGLYCGANVDFVDIDASTGLMDVGKLSEKLKNAEIVGKLPKIVVPVHLSGISCNMKEIKKLSEKYKFYILEDASHALGGKYKGKTVGSCIYSHITVFSCHPVKIITSGEGGIITTNNDHLFKRMKSLRSHGITKNKNNFLEKDPAPWIYEQHELGFNYRITDIQSALGLNQLNRLEIIVKERNRLFSRYINLLKDKPLKFLDIPKDVNSSIHLGMINLIQYDPKKHRKLFKYLRDEGIGVQVHYIPVHLQPYYKRKGFKKGDFPNAERHGENVLSLPLFPGLKEYEQNYVVEKINEFFINN